MEDVTKPQHLMRRQSTYYFRRSVPNELRQIIGKSDLKNSLGTTDLGVAKRRLAEKVLFPDEAPADATLAVVLLIESSLERILERRRHVEPDREERQIAS